MANARYVIAIDGSKVYLRRTVCVIHHAESGEIEYDAKPVSPSQAPLRIRKAFHAVERMVAIDGGAKREGQ